ncbi:MAG: D-2-hydroxyacid dehydrogenase [bacterium]|nr:D-2-hydroxyacid dehydrogenase [bacterium]
MRVLVYHPHLTAEYEVLLRGQLDLTILPCLTEDEVAARAPAADVVFGWRLPPGSLAAARRLRFVQLMGAGADDLLADPTFDPRVPVACARGSFGPWIAEYVLAMLLMVEKDIRRLVRQQEASYWDPYRVGTLRGKVLGLAGLGSTRDLARAAGALGMTVVGYRRTAGRVEGVRQVWCGSQLPAFLSGLDYLVLALPLTLQTQGRVGMTEFSYMKPSAWLINIGRGRVVREQDLVKALRAGVIRGAVLDVFAEEPLPPESPLWTMDNVVVTPHVAAPSLPQEMVRLFLGNLRRQLAGQPLEGLVDRERGY